MRILLVNNNLNRLGGTDSLFFDSVRLLRQRGADVSTFVTSPDHELRQDHDWVVREPSGLLGMLRETFWSTVARDFNRFCQTVKPDLVHIHGYPVGIGPMLSVLERLRVPYVQTIHDSTYILPVAVTARLGWSRNLRWYQLLGLTSGLDRRRIRQMVRSCRLVIAPSQAMADLARRQGFTRTETIYNFKQARPVVARAPATPVVTYVGRLTAIKGVDWLLRAFALMIKNVPASRLEIIGDGPERKLLETLSTSLGLGSAITFVGAVPSDVVYQHLSQSRVLVIPSVTFENNPLSGLEALQVGTPIIGNRIGGIPELIDDGYSGFVVSIENSEQVADRLATLLRDDSVWRQMSQRSIALFTERFSPEIHVARLLQVYQNVING